MSEKGRLYGLSLRFFASRQTLDGSRPQKRLRFWGLGLFFIFYALVLVCPASSLAASPAGRLVHLQGQVAVSSDGGAKWQVAAGEFIWFSAVTHEGRDRLWARLLASLGRP